MNKEAANQKFLEIMNKKDNLGKSQRAKKKKKVTKIHQKIKNQRKDFHHKLSNRLVQNNHTIVFTNINIAKLKKTQLKGHAKSWSDIG